MLSLSIFGSLTLSVALLWLALRKIDFNILAGTFTTVQLIPCLLSAFAVAGSMTLRSIRWRLICGLPYATRGQFARSTYLGYLLNQLLPGRIGDLARVAALARLLSLNFATPLASAILDRFIDIAVLIGSAGILYLALPLDPKLRLWISYLIVASLIFLVILFFFLKATHLWAGIISKFSARWMQRWSLQPDVILLEFRHELHRMLFDWTRFGKIFAIALTILGCDYLIIAALFLSLEVPLTPIAPLLVLFCLAAGSTLPSAPGYVGVYQIAAVMAFTFFMYPAEKALVLATLLQLITLAVSLVMNGRGVFTLSRYGRPGQPSS